MGGFTGLFDRPDPYVTSLTKNPSIQRGIDANLGDWTSARSQNQAGLSDFITKYLADQGNAEKYAGQETGAISQFYNGDMANQLAALRAKRTSAVTNAADVGVQQALRNVDLSRVGEQGGGGSYDRRLAIGAVTPIRTAAALDSVNQERGDLDYLTGNRIALAGARTGIADRLAGRALVPGQARFSALSQQTGGLAPIIQQDQANKFYGIKQDPGLLDRMQQEVQFLQGLQSIMKNQYGTASEAYGGWSGMGGGGGMGGMMGGMGGMRRGGMVESDYTAGGDVHGPGTGTSDSVPARLSDGEYVIPARVVRMPGVLPLLEKLRRMGGEGPTTDEAAARHFAGGGLYYADSFGDLGHQALARDAFNESVVGGQVQQIQQQNQFDSQQRLSRQNEQDANARSILDYQKQFGIGGNAGGYQRMSPSAYTTNEPTAADVERAYRGEPMPFARGGLVYRGMPRYSSAPYMARQRASDHLPPGDQARSYADIRQGEMARNHPQPGTFQGHFASGGLVKGYAAGGYADGGEVNPEDTRILLHKLAQKAAANMLGSDAPTLEQQRFQLERDRTASADTRANRQLQLQEDYQNYLKEQGTPSSQRATQIRDTAIVKGAEEGIDPSDQPELTQGASPEAIALAHQRAQAVRPVYEAQRDRSVAIADLLNKQKDLTDFQDQLQKNAPPGRSFHFNFDAAQGAKDADQAERVRGSHETALANTTKQLTDIQGRLSKLSKGEADQNAYFDINSGRYIPMVPEPNWRKKAAAATAAGPISRGNQGFEASETRGYAPKYPPQFYTRVNQLVAKGMDAREAKSQAIMEMEEAR